MMALFLVEMFALSEEMSRSDCDANEHEYEDCEVMLKFSPIGLLTGQPEMMMRHQKMSSRSVKALLLEERNWNADVEWRIVC
jgi:hypothetical protein